jgi:alpha-L-fucosidase
MNCISKNGNLLLNVGPDEKGLIPQKSKNLMTKLAKWFAYHQGAVHETQMSEYQAPDGCFYTQKDDNLYLYLSVQPIGDIILPQLNGKIEKAELMRTGDEVEQVTYWGYELLAPDEIRIRPSGCIATDVIKIKLLS